MIARGLRMHQLVSLRFRTCLFCYHLALLGLKPELIKNSEILPPSFTDIEYHSSTVIYESSNIIFFSFLIYFFYLNLISRRSIDRKSSIRNMQKNQFNSVKICLNTLIRELMAGLLPKIGILEENGSRTV